jgi:conjugative transfer signal peptidase TraF
MTLLSLAAYGAGYRINLTPSVPRGLWKIGEFNTQLEQPQKDDYVTVALDGNPGYQLAIERGYLVSPMHMLKRIVGVEGDFVSYDVYEKSVMVNGGYILMTEVLSQDTEGLPMPSAPFPTWIGNRQVWLSSENIRGYDSRYFGPVSSDVLRKATPVWVFR